MPLQTQLTLGISVLIVMLLLIACGSADTSSPDEDSSDNVPAASAPNSEPTSAVDSGQQTEDLEGQSIRVGTIESVEGDAISIVMVDGLLKVSLSGDTVVQRFAEGSFADLAIGQRVTVIAQRGEEVVTARTVIVTLEGTSLMTQTGRGFGGQFQGPGGGGQFQGPAGGGQFQRPGGGGQFQGPGGGGQFQGPGGGQFQGPGGGGQFQGPGGGQFQGGRPVTLVGNIERIDGMNIVVNTGDGPVVASISVNTSIQLPLDAPIEDLSPGQLVTVTGTDIEDGGIAAQTILITPDLGNLLGGQAFGSAQASGASGGSSTIDDARLLEFDEQRQAGEYEGVTFLVNQGSEATFTVVERLALLPLSSNVVMRTTALSGNVHFDGSQTVIETTFTN